MDAFIILIVLIPLMAGVRFFLGSRFSWQCQKCGHTFSLSPVAATFLPHTFGGRKLAKCPNCGSLTWATRVLEH